MLLKTFDQNIILFNYLKVLVVRLPLLRLVLHLPIPVFCLFLFSLLLPFIVFSFSLPLSLFVVYSQSLMLLDDLLFFDRLAAFYLVFLPVWWALLCLFFLIFDLLFLNLLFYLIVEKLLMLIA